MAVLVINRVIECDGSAHACAFMHPCAIEGFNDLSTSPPSISGTNRKYN